ncbi:Hydrogenase expression/formation protein hupG [Bradyrhizobium sp. ORS 278]|uniref:hydrogenase accessory protein n=1 Tax=Bradyrhizobium sp. (strain ORS 278) TaxID=114615 RepID=UPI00015076BE|nr:hydrogenase accessory protein [Bradyrhizobium sp. ORS 278]CAL75566.1 Hydrogenase expression/formation protein hupG [Bradyrhizobium sp. ORS 278]
MERLQRDATRTRGELPEVDTVTVDAFLDDVSRAGAIAVLLSAGDPARFPEAMDVAIVLPELITAFHGRLQGAVIERDAEAELGARFGVRVQPSLIFCRGSETLGVIAKIQDWSVYVDRISRLIDRPAGTTATVVASIIPAHQPSGVDR